MLYSDPGLSAEKILASSSITPEIEVTDEYGVSHRVSKVSDPNTIKMIVSAMEDKKLIIADGHHRYETALSYSKEFAPKSTASTERSSASLPQPAYPEAAMMMTFVNMDSDGLVILPTHRVVFGLEGFNPSDFLESARSFYQVEEMDDAAPQAFLDRLKQVGADRAAFLAIFPTGRYLLTAKAAETSEALKNVSARQRQLAVVQLHLLVLENLLGISTEAIREQRNLRYVREAGEAIEQVTRGEADAAFLMNPITMTQLREVAFAGEVLPQKSTDFYPKLLSGLAIYGLD